MPRMATRGVHALLLALHTCGHRLARLTRTVLIADRSFVREPRMMEDASRRRDNRARLKVSTQSTILEPPN
eukprot:4206595-Prymnesium_polylepis.1